MSAPAVDRGPIFAELPPYEPPPPWIPPEKRSGHVAYDNDLRFFLPRTLLLRRQTLHDSLGFNVRGGAEHKCGMFVSGVNPQSETFRLGLKEGDEILMVNGIKFEMIEHDRAVQILKSSLDVEMTVRYFPYGYNKSYELIQVIEDHAASPSSQPVQPLTHDQQPLPRSQNALSPSSPSAFQPAGYGGAQEQTVHQHQQSPQQQTDRVQGYSPYAQHDERGRGYNQSGDRARDHGHVDGGAYYQFGSDGSDYNQSSDRSRDYGQSGDQARLYDQERGMHHEYSDSRPRGYNQSQNQGYTPPGGRGRHYNQANERARDHGHAYGGYDQSESRANHSQSEGRFGQSGLSDERAGDYGQSHGRSWEANTGNRERGYQENYRKQEQLYDDQQVDSRAGSYDRYASSNPYYR